MGPYKIADSIWPRTGGDRSNRAHAPLAGPRRGIIATEARLPVFDPDRPSGSNRGVALAEDGTMVVTHDGYLCMVSPGGKVKSVDLRTLEESDLFLSPPVVLKNGHVAMNSWRHLILTDGDGVVLDAIPLATNAFLEIEWSPNVSSAGDLVLSSPPGTVEVFGDTRGTFDLQGYDPPPPAFYPDDSMAMCAYAGWGLCRIGLDGKLLWKAALNQACLLPAINDEGICAAGSLNQKKSIIVDGKGKTLGFFREAAIFSEHSEGNWIALGKSGVSLVRSDGRTLWTFPDLTDDFPRRQAAVDGDGFTYAPIGDHLVALKPDGSCLFTLRFGTQSDHPTAVSIIGDGVAAVLAGRSMYVIR